MKPELMNSGVSWRKSIHDFDNYKRTNLDIRCSLGMVIWNFRVGHGQYNGQSGPWARDSKSTVVQMIRKILSDERLF